MTITENCNERKYLFYFNMIRIFKIKKNVY